MTQFNYISGEQKMKARSRLMAAGLDGKVDFGIYRIQGAAPPEYKVFGSFKKQGEPAVGAFMTTQDYGMVDGLIGPVCDSIIAYFRKEGQ
jgi:hypothetical protein